jgi:purine-binding chemotaxis protein CheW
MRLLPIEPVAGAPLSVLGLCSVRGLAVPVVSLGTLLGGDESPLRSMATLRIGARIVAVAVESVVGVRAFGAEEATALPPLLREAAGEVVSAVGMLDAEFLLFLRSARIAPTGLMDRIEFVGPEQ